MTDLLFKLTREGYSVSFVPFYIDDGEMASVYSHTNHSKDAEYPKVINILMSKGTYHTNRVLSGVDVFEGSLEPDEVLKYVLGNMRDILDRDEMIRKVNGFK